MRARNNSPDRRAVVVWRWPDGLMASAVLRPGLSAGANGAELAGAYDVGEGTLDGDGLGFLAMAILGGRNAEFVDISEDDE